MRRSQSGSVKSRRLIPFVIHNSSFIPSSHCVARINTSVSSWTLSTRISAALQSKTLVARESPIGNATHTPDLCFTNSINNKWKPPASLSP